MNTYDMTKCQRCGDQKPGSTTMSRFNTQIICGPCSDDERNAPGYKAAAEREHQEVLRKNYNFSGVGLSPADHEFLRLRREERKAKQAAEAKEVAA